MLLMYNELMYNELCRLHSCSPCTTQTFNTTRAHQTDSAMVGSISDRQEKYSLSGWFCGIVWTDRKRTTARPLSILGQVVDISCVPIPGLHTSYASYVTGRQWGWFHLVSKTHPNVSHRCVLILKNTLSVFFSAHTIWRLHTGGK